MHINVFAKSDEIPSLPVQVIKEKPKCQGLRLTKGNNSKRIGPYPLFAYYKCSSCGYQCIFAKFYEIPSLPFQDIEKPKCRGQKDGQTDGLMDGQTM